MYTVKPRGINIRQTERDVADGFLQESINLQWRDGAYRPIPERLVAGITDYTSSFSDAILHKVSDEDKINVLLFGAGGLAWYGVIENGVYTSNASTEIINIPSITDQDSLSFTILNGLIYFMSKTDEFYYRVQFNETDETYEAKDMYAWKSLIPYYPRPINYEGSFPKLGNPWWADITGYLLSQCGVILTRFTLVLKTGEEVLHSPIYVNVMYAINLGRGVTTSIEKDDLLTNIHTIVNTNLEFNNSSLFDEEISAINIYASIPYYETKVLNSVGTNIYTQVSMDKDTLRGKTQDLAEKPFYLVKTIDKPSVDQEDNAIMFYVGTFDSDIDYSQYDLSKIDVSTIASGQPMPADNFSYHKVYGDVTSYNGRLVIKEPKTILSEGHIRSLSYVTGDSKVGFYIDTEDGTREAVSFEIDAVTTLFDTDRNSFRGILSYPDSQANYAGGSSTLGDEVRLYKLRGNKAHNLACAFDFYAASWDVFAISEDANDVFFSISTSALLLYKDADIVTIANPPVIDSVSYTSENRLQFSESGEFSIWPAINSYRVGEGKIVFVGDNSIDPTNADYIAPLIIGTSDGVYTVNFDPTGANLIQSITKAANMPAISPKNIQIDQSLIYVSDKGLINIRNGEITNITRDFFPEQGNGDFPAQNTVYPNYTILTSEALGNPNPYVLTDIVDYMKGAIFAYDGRRNNLWCSNPTKNFSLVFNLTTNQWDMSTYVFKKTIELFSTMDTSEGDIYSRFLVVNSSDLIDILSAENSTEEVYVHMMTRPIKMQMPDQYKKVQRLISRCELYRDPIEDGYFTFGLWGKQDINRDKVSIPLAAYRQTSLTGFPNNVRQDIPVGRQKGKYKAITILQGGKFLPNSSFEGFDIVALPVENKILR